MAATVQKGLFVIPLFFGLALASQPAQAQIGFAAGYGIHVLNKPDFSSTATNTFDSPGGINVGMFYDFRFNNVTFRPGIFFRQGDFDWELDGVSFSPLQSTIRLAEFPIDFLYHFRTPSISPYVAIGPSFNFLHTSQPDLRQNLDMPEGTTFFMGIDLGVGLEFSPAGMGLILFPEIRYNYALSGFIKEEYIVRTVPFASDAQRISSLTFRLGISWRRGEY